MAGTFQREIAVFRQIGQHFRPAIDPSGRLGPSTLGDNDGTDTDFGFLPCAREDGAANGTKTNQCN
jgi:hypothetical protein